MESVRELLTARSTEPTVRPAGRHIPDELADALEHGPFSRALTLAIQHGGLSLHRLQYRMAQHGVHVSTTTLSYWKNGRSRPERAGSLHAVGVLENLLGLPDRTLVALLGPRRPRGRWINPEGAGLRIEHLFDEPDELVSLINGLDMPMLQPLRVISVDESLEVDADRRQRRLRVREVVMATEDRVAYSYIALRGITPGRPPAVLSTKFCRLGRVRVCEDMSLLLAELVLDRVLAKGDKTVREYELDIRDTEQDTLYDRRFPLSAHEYVLQVNFHPDAVPARCTSFRQDTASAPVEDIGQVWIDHEHVAHLVEVDLTPGIYGLRWEWS